MGDVIAFQRKLESPPAKAKECRNGLSKTLYDPDIRYAEYSAEDWDNWKRFGEWLVFAGHNIISGSDAQFLPWVKEGTDALYDVIQPTMAAKPTFYSRVRGCYE